MLSLLRYAWYINDSEHSLFLNIPNEKSSDFITEKGFIFVQKEGQEAIILYFSVYWPIGVSFVTRHFLNFFEMADNNTGLASEILTIKTLNII